MLSGLAAFGRFWYRFIVGDDWVIAVAIALALVADYLLLRSGYNSAWWLLPVVVIGIMAVSLWRGRNTPP
jgi:hypothetical protein